MDEFEIGTTQAGEQGRSKSPKKVKVVIAFEYRDDRSGRGYARITGDYSAQSLRPLFDTHIGNDADILADGWIGVHAPTIYRFDNSTVLQFHNSLYSCKVERGNYP